MLPSRRGGRPRRRWSSRRAGPTLFKVGEADLVPFKVGRPGPSTLFTLAAQVLPLTKGLLGAADIGEPRPRPFTVLAFPSPNVPTPALPRKVRSTVNAHRPQPFRFFARAGTLTAPGPVSDPGRADEHEAELLLTRRLRRRDAVTP